MNRLTWLNARRDAVEGLRFRQEPPARCLFFSRLEPLCGWGGRLAPAFASGFRSEF